MTHQRLSEADVLLSILDELPIAVFVKDEDLRFVYSNKLNDEAIGRPEAELLGRTDRDIFEEQLADRNAAQDHEVMDFGETAVFEGELKDEAGVLTPVLKRKARLQLPDGKIFLLGTSSDLTDMRAREHEYRALSETVPVAVARIDEALAIMSSNPLFNAYCGGDGAEADQARFINKMRQAHAGFPGEACKFETVVQGLGNLPRSVLVISSGWLDLGGGTRSAIVSLVDISQMTELQRINEEVSRLNRELATNMGKLRDAQDELLRTGKLDQLGQLTATVAHELRNPLGTVRNSTFLLERKLKDKGLGVEALLERIDKGIDRCDNIISQLLDFSRSTHLKFQPNNLDAWLTAIVDEEAKKLPYTFTVHLDLGLGGQQVPFDPDRLQRAVINMMSNAAEALQDMPEPPQEPAIRISTFHKNDYVSLRIADNGPGMTPEVLSRIREPLFTTKSFGTGLGIPAIEQIAIQHGGRLDVVSEPGQGSRFTVWLPVKRAAA